MKTAAALKETESSTDAKPATAAWRVYQGVTTTGAIDEKDLIVRFLPSSATLWTASSSRCRRTSMPTTSTAWA